MLPPIADGDQLTCFLFSSPLNHFFFSVAITVSLVQISFFLAVLLVFFRQSVSEGQLSPETLREDIEAMVLVFISLFVCPFISRFCVIFFPSFCTCMY